MFFVKQNTAYEQRISDWSSDVCSSDLGNYQHISEKLENLERDGYIVIGSTDRSGTRYEVRLPEAVPSVRERMAEAQEVEPAAVDYFGEPERRAEVDRKSVVSGNSVAVRVDNGGGGILKKKK